MKLVGTKKAGEIAGFFCWLEVNGARASPCGPLYEPFCELCGRLCGRLCCEHASALPSAPPRFVPPCCGHATRQSFFSLLPFCFSTMK